MTDSDRAKLVLLISSLAATFGRDADAAMFRGFEMALDDMPLADIESGVRKAMRQCRFMPTAAELRELSGDISGAARAQLAWDAVSEAIGDVGYYGSVDFDDKCINATIHHLGGWEQICQVGDLPEGQEERSREQVAWLRREFEKYYARFYESGISPDSARACIGYHDRTNANGGYSDRVKKPQLVLTGLPQTRELIRHSSAPVKRLSSPVDGPQRLGECLP